MLASQNVGKVNELKTLLASQGIEIISAPTDLDVAETGITFKANALLKAQAYGDHFSSTTLADDSGLMIEALDGGPGIYAARWAQEAGGYETLFQQLEEKLRGHNDPKATFVCVLCLYTPGQTPLFFEGRLEGHLTFPPQGVNGFGYDPIFVPAGYDVTCAQLSGEEKNKISHRHRALEALLASLTK